VNFSVLAVKCFALMLFMLTYFIPVYYFSWKVDN
jgi:hypothetical protein